MGQCQPRVWEMIHDQTMASRTSSSDAVASSCHQPCLVHILGRSSPMQAAPGSGSRQDIRTFLVPSPSPCSPPRGNHYSDFCCSCVFYFLFLNFAYIEFYSVCSFRSGSFPPNVTFARFIHIIGRGDAPDTPLFPRSPLHEYACC